MRRGLSVFVLGLLATAALVAGIVAPGKASSAATTKVRVSASEFKYVLSKKAAPTGTVVFTLVNKGKLAHDFKIAGKKTAIVAPGKSATLRVKIAKKGRFGYLCTVPGHAAAGMKGVFAAG